MPTPPPQPPKSLSKAAKKYRTVSEQRGRQHTEDVSDVERRNQQADRVGPHQAEEVQVAIVNKFGRPRENVPRDSYK